MEYPKRKSNRLTGYDYSQPAAYFVTICANQRKCVFSRISVGDGFPVPYPAGQIAEDFTEQLSIKFPSVRVDRHVIMPNHIHLLLAFESICGTGNPSPTLGEVIGWYKYKITQAVNQQRKTPGERLFQRSYHDHVIRDEADYLKIWNYIDTNPAKWEKDCFFTK